VNPTPLWVKENIHGGVGLLRSQKASRILHQRSNYSLNGRRGVGQ
jgi:hypothetical protein